MDILIVDDSFAGRRLLSVYLKSLGNIDQASNGMEAIEAFRLRLSTENPYDVIFLDIMMPEVDGLQALEEIRAEESKHNIPIENRVKIVMSSALDEKKEIMKAMDLGCDGYLIKPIDSQQLERLLQELKIGEI